MAEKREKRYVSDNARLMAEWNWEKNNELGIKPENFSCGSDKKVWWICAKGHEWPATISSRNSGCGCRYCAGTYVIKGENDLQTVNPTVAKEWDYEKNTGLTPSDVLPNSHKEIWWKCELGHKWKARVSKRTAGQNCPYCSGKKAWKGYNDLSTTNPELVSEWDFEKNQIPIYEYRPMSNKKVWWICDKGHSWDAAIAKRVAGEKCPYCQGKKILIGFNDLATTHPSLVQEWDFEKNKGITPQDVSKGSEANIWWKCNRNHSWRAIVSSRTSGSGCSHCAKEIQTSFPEKAIYYYIKKLFPDAIPNYRSKRLAQFELDIFIPSLQIGIEYDGERWHHSVENDLQKNKLCVEMGISLIRIREPACPVLADKLSICIIRENKKKGLDKTIKRLFLEISQIVGIEYTTYVDLEKDSASILELLSFTEKDNSIHTIAPNLAKEWDCQKNGTLLPSMITSGSDKKVWWICTKGHSYQASISSRIRGRGCSICSGKKVLTGFNDIATTHPNIAKQWCDDLNDIKSTSVSAGSTKKVWWQCNVCGHRWESRVYNRCLNKTGCPECAKLKRKASKDAKKN